MPVQSGRTSPGRNQSWFASAAVVLGAVFLLLTLREGHPAPYQRVIDSILHNWATMAALAAFFSCVRRGWLGTVRGVIHGVAGVLVLFFGLFSAMGLIGWGPLWEILGPFGISRTESEPIVFMSMFAVWFFAFGVLTLRGFVRWIGKRYEHHGVAVGLGPVYLYFRRRRSS